jgi:ferrochelatase
MTTRLLADKLGLEKDSFSTTFQSRMSKNWISPFTDKAIRDLAAMGKKHLLIASPSFVADCLETLIEIREDYKDIFFAAGGEKLEFVDSLNYDDIWVEAIIRILASPEQSRI